MAIDENIEGLKKEEVKLFDDVSNLEREHEKVNNQIYLIDEAQGLRLCTLIGG